MPLQGCKTFMHPCEKALQGCKGFVHYCEKALQSCKGFMHYCEKALQGCKGFMHGCNGLCTPAEPPNTRVMALQRCKSVTRGAESTRHV
mgnify:CR=1 FL=1